MAHYTDYKHPDFQKNKQKWVDTQRIYDGTAYDFFPAINSDGTINTADDKRVISRYVPRKTQREHIDAYHERLLLLDPQMMFFAGITSLVGVWADAEKDTDRTWQPEDKTMGFGDPTDKDSIAWKIIHNADGHGTNLDFVVNRMAIKLAMKQRVWILVDGRPKGDDGKSIGEASVKVIDPEFVKNWWVNPKTKRLEWVLVQEHRDDRDSFEDNPEPKEMYTEYRLDGWRRFYVKDGKNNDSVEVDKESGTYNYYRTSDKNPNDKILPIFQVEVPVDVNAGYLWAKKSNSIMNFESRLDFAHMTLAFALKQIVAKDKKEFDLIIEKLKEGGNILMQKPGSSRDHKFLQQDSSFLEASAKRLEKKVKDFFYSMFKAYGDAAREKTAREIDLESKTGLESYLALLVGAINEADNGWMWRMSQVYFPKNPELWGDAYINRKADFAPKDVDAQLNQLQKRYMNNKPIPLSKDQWKKLLKMFYEEDGLDNPDEAILAELADRLVASLSQEADLETALGLN